jgi:predicted translin family RNA/ssDNA-binding protein
MQTQSERSSAEQLLQVLFKMAQCCSAQIECVRTGDLSRVKSLGEEKEQLLEELSRLVTGIHKDLTRFTDVQDRIRQAVDTYMVMETAVQKALSERSGELVDKLMAHYKARLGQEGYENVAKLFTPVARLFPDSSRYIDESR